MPSINNWLADTGTFDADADRIIERDVASVVFARGASNISAQTVRIVPARQNTTGTEKRGLEGSQTAEQMVVIIGGSALDVLRDDRFTFRGVVYKVVSVDKSMNNKTEALARGIQ